MGWGGGISGIPHASLTDEIDSFQETVSTTSRERRHTHLISGEGREPTMLQRHVSEILLLPRFVGEKCQTSQSFTPPSRGDPLPAACFALSLGCLADEDFASILKTHGGRCCPRGNMTRGRKSSAGGSGAEEVLHVLGCSRSRRA